MSFLQNLLNSIITKYLKQQADDHLSICENEHSPYGLSICNWRYKDLSMLRDQKVNLSILNREVQSSTVVVFTAQI